MIVPFMGKRRRGERPQETEAKKHGLDAAQGAVRTGQHWENPGTRAWRLGRRGSGRSLDQAMQGVRGGRFRPWGSIPDPTWLSGTKACAVLIGNERVSDPKAARAKAQMPAQHWVLLFPLASWSVGAASPIRLAAAWWDASP